MRWMREPLLQITTQQLDYLVAVSRSPTWAAAAEELGVTPSALSQGLAELERRVGVPLFRRVGRRREVEPAAAEVVAYAERVIAQTRDLGRWAAANREGASGNLRVGMIDLAAVHHYPAAMDAFRAQRPEMQLHLVVAPSTELLRLLADSEIALAVVVEPPADLPGVQLTPLIAEPLSVYAPPGAGGPPKQWGPWVSFPETSHTRHHIARALAEIGSSFEVIGQSHQPEVLRRMVQLGMGWTVLPRIQAESEPMPLTAIRRQPLVRRRLVLARRVDSPADPAADALTALISASS